MTAQLGLQQNFGTEKKNMQPNHVNWVKGKLMKILKRIFNSLIIVCTFGILHEKLAGFQDDLNEYDLHNIILFFRNDGKESRTHLD